MENYKNTEEQIARIKQLISEETLYGKLVDNNLITEGSGLRSIVDDIIDIYQIPVAYIDNVKNALPDGIETTLKNLDSFTKINKVIGVEFSIADFKKYLGSNGDFTNDIKTFLKDVNIELDDTITTGMKIDNPNYSPLLVHQKNWGQSVDEVIEQIKGLDLSSGVVSVDDVEKTFLKNFDEFIKNYKKVAAKYKNLKAFNKAITHFFGNHEGDLIGLLTKIQDHYKKVINVKDWGNYKAYIGRYKEGWNNIINAKGKWAKVKEYAKLSYKVLPVGYYQKYINALIAKTLIMVIYCNEREQYDPFQMEEGVIHNKKIIKEDEEGYTALDPTKNAILSVWDNIYPILNIISVFFQIPFTTIMLDPMKLLGAGFSDMSCENFYVRRIKDFESEIVSLIDSGESLTIKTDDGEIKTLSGSELKSELDKAVDKFKSAGEDPLQLLKDLFTFGNDISSFTLVGDNGEDIPMLDSKRINPKWLNKIKELHEEYGGGE